MDAHAAPHPTDQALSASGLGKLDSASAAPLLCGGVTVYSPMRRYGIGATSSVAVIGIGGLGHMAIRMLRALGAEITAFSTSPDKKPEDAAKEATEERACRHG